LGRSRGGRFGSRFAYGCVRLRGSEFQSFIQPTKLPRSVLSNSWSSPSSLCWIRPTASLACGCQSAQGFSGGPSLTLSQQGCGLHWDLRFNVLALVSGCQGGGQRGLGSSAGPTVSTPEGLMNLNSKKEGERGREDKHFVSSRLGSVFPRPK
jgi:hypothetical protein